MHSDTKFVRRRLLVTGAAALAATAGVRAQAPELRRYAVISLIGDQLVLVYANRVTGSSLDRNLRRPPPDANGSFDKFALTAVGQAIERADPKAKVSLLGVGPSPLHETPEKLLDGKTMSLPGSLVTALDQMQATHVVLLTKYRGETNIPLRRERIGIGSLRGLGYYIDGSPSLRMADTGKSGEGLLAPYVYVQLTLADARTGAVLRQQTVAAAQAYAVAEHDTAVDPWDVLTSEEKISRLRRLLETQLADETAKLLAHG